MKADSSDWPTFKAKQSGYAQVQNYRGILKCNFCANLSVSPICDHMQCKNKVVHRI